MVRTRGRNTKFGVDLSLLSSQDRRIDIAPGRPNEEGKSDDYNFRLYQDAIDKEALNYWFWHGLCKLYVAKNDLDGVIQSCELGIKKFSTSPSPLMQLGNLYAAKGYYTSAMNKSNELWNFKPSILRLASKDGKSPLATSSYNATKVLPSLEG